MKPTLVVLTGAGVSAESGIRTFRDSDGLWEGHDVRAVASPEGWHKDKEAVLRFYNERRRDILNAQPNEAHRILAALQEHFNVYIVTQNIDDLHERAGSKYVLHLHGEIFKMRGTLNPQKIYDIKGDINLGDKAEDGSQLRPHIVWFGEEVPMIGAAAQIMELADYFLLIGTSLVVYPAAGLINYVPDDAPKYIVDKSIPDVGQYRNVIPVEKPATEGMADVQRLLMEALRAR